MPNTQGGFPDSLTFGRRFDFIVPSSELTTIDVGFFISRTGLGQGGEAIGSLTFERKVLYAALAAALHPAFYALYAAVRVALLAAMLGALHVSVLVALHAACPLQQVQYVVPPPHAALHGTEIHAHRR